MCQNTADLLSHWRQDVEMAQAHSRFKLNQDCLHWTGTIFYIYCELAANSSLTDICCGCSNVNGEEVFMAVATEETEHITRMVSQQKRTKKRSKVVKIFIIINAFFWMFLLRQLHRKPQRRSLSIWFADLFCYFTWCDYKHTNIFLKFLHCVQLCMASWPGHKLIFFSIFEFLGDICVMLLSVNVVAEERP